MGGWYIRHGIIKRCNNDTSDVTKMFYVSHARHMQLDSKQIASGISLLFEKNKVKNKPAQHMHTPISILHADFLKIL